MLQHPVWDIQFGSISNANDHNQLGYIAGGAPLAGTVYAGVIDTTPVPLPPALLLLAPGFLGVGAIRRKLRK